MGDKVMKLYVCGKMRGIFLFNFPEFNDVSDELRRKGHDVFNPAEQDVTIDGFDPAKDTPKTPSYYMKRDLPAVCDCDAIACLPSWRQSGGARMEVFVGLALGKQILDAYTLAPIDSIIVKHILVNFIREDHANEKV